MIDDCWNCDFGMARKLFIYSTNFKRKELTPKRKVIKIKSESEREEVTLELKVDFENNNKSVAVDCINFRSAKKSRLMTTKNDVVYDEVGSVGVDHQHD